jgi:hypothetical protein
MKIFLFSVTTWIPGAKYSVWESNPRPSACKADVITAIQTKQRLKKITDFDFIKKFPLRHSYFSFLQIKSFFTMREGQYEIIVLDDRDRPLTEEVISDRSFVTAQPGSSYHVKINVYRNKSGQFPAKYLRLGLYVDGNDVQYWKRLDLSDEKTLPKDYSLPICSIFWGFKKNTSEIRSFVFAKPGLSSNSGSQFQESELGSVKLVIHEAKLQQGIFNNNCGIHETPSGISLANEDQKFWTRPSVVTSSGRKIESEREKFVPLLRWENASEIPLKVMTLFYHSADMMRFLKNPQIQLKRPHEEVSGELNEQNRKKGREGEEEEETPPLLNHLGDAVVEVVREKEVPLLDLTDETAPIWGSVKLKK